MKLHQTMRILSHDKLYLRDRLLNAIPRGEAAAWEAFFDVAIKWESTMVGPYET